MVWDGHVHLNSPPGPPDRFKTALLDAGIEGALVISSPPDSETWQKRLREILAWAKAVPALLPFFWLDPLAPDADEQISVAAAAGIAGFKCICTHCGPDDPRVMARWNMIAVSGKPLLFHTGILIGPADSRFCQPLCYEALLGVPGLRFCLAHSGWPWSDECVALFLKWRNCLRQGRTTAELFLDATPGSPGIHRERMLEGIFQSGLGVEERIYFGTDLRTEYDIESLTNLIGRDDTILRRLHLTAAQLGNYFGGNLHRFVYGDRPAK
ncbi:MAG: amidohydrolase [Planctomycetes bacterium]|nr:amidohydrolase [Planctomycetota bacterium]